MQSYTEARLKPWRQRRGSTVRVDPSGVVFSQWTMNEPDNLARAPQDGWYTDSAHPSAHLRLILVVTWVSTLRPRFYHLT